MLNRIALLLVLLLAGCEVHHVVLVDPPPPEVPGANVPLAMRQKNWASTQPGTYGQGSCGNASTINVLRWHGEEKLADYWRTKYMGGVTSVSLTNAWTKEGIPYCTTFDPKTYECSGDPEFLEWVSETKRAAVIWFKEFHSCSFHGYVVRDGKEYAAVLDNNYPQDFEYIPKVEFIKKWRGFGGFAITPVSPNMQPSSPIPYPVVLPKDNSSTRHLWN